MGFDTARFVVEVDEELHCRRVLEEPIQSLCDHLFCRECIQGWLAANKSCPVDRGSLELDDLRPAVMFICNMLAELDIKCEFQPQGCQAIVKLKNLKDHLTYCEYNPELEISCDKGCNMKMSLEEYQTKNCLIHLANRGIPSEERTFILSRQREHFESIMKRLQDDITNINVDQKLDFK